MCQLLRKNLVLAVSPRFSLWKKYARHKSLRNNKGYTKLVALFNVRAIRDKQETFATIEYYANTIIRIIEKIEKAYLIDRHRLLREILTLYYRDGIERLTTTSAPYKFDRWMTLKKNGYKYLGLLLRKFVKKRTVEVFDWYSRVYSVLRYACVLGRMMDRCLKQRG